LTHSTPLPMNFTHLLVRGAAIGSPGRSASFCRFQAKLLVDMTLSARHARQVWHLVISTEVELQRTRSDGQAFKSLSISGAIFPSAYRCTKLIYYEHYRDIRAAIARETQLKKWSRAKKVELINRLNPRWMDIGDQVLGE